ASAEPLNHSSRLPSQNAKVQGKPAHRSIEDLREPPPRGQLASSQTAASTDSQIRNRRRICPSRPRTGSIRCAAHHTAKVRAPSIRLLPTLQEAGPHPPRAPLRPPSLRRVGKNPKIGEPTCPGLSEYQGTRSRSHEAAWQHPPWFPRSIGRLRCPPPRG